MLGVRHHRCTAHDVDNGLSEFQEFRLVNPRLSS